MGQSSYSQPSSGESKTTPDTADGPSPGFEAAATPTPSPSRPRLIALHQAWSHNGYGTPHDGTALSFGSSSETNIFDVCWDGGDGDPLCPRSFSQGRKWLIVIISFASLCTTCASSIYSTTYKNMEAEFHNSRMVSVLGLSAFILGAAFGPMVLGPMSEFYGRRPIYLAAWSAFLIWLIPQAVTRHIAVLIVFRSVDGFSGAVFLAVSGGTVGDLFASDELHLPLALFSASPFVGPGLGPLVGGFINYFADWRWTYYMLIWGFVLWVAIILYVPETYRPMLLREKARRRRIETGEERWMAPSERVQRSVTNILLQSLLRPFQLLISEPMCLGLCLLSSVLLGILYLFFGAFPLVFGKNHGFNLWQTGLTFLGILIATILGVAMDPLWNSIRNRLIRKHELQTGIEGCSEPEYRLVSAIFGSLLVLVGLFMFAWSTYPWVHYMVPIIGSAFFRIG